MNPQPEPLESVLELEVGRVADEFEALCRQGQPPAIEEFVGRYPHLAEVLREILPAVQILQMSSVQNADTEKPAGLDTSPRAPAGKPGPVLLDGAYEILGELGRGGMGIVYKARQVALDRIVALKMIRAGVAASPDVLVRFQREAQTVAQLRHPNIVQIHAVGESAAQPYFSLEYLEGGSLAAKLNGQPQPPRQAAELVETLARAIDAAHHLGLVHRDLKPANVLLAADGTPKITDFGLVKHLADDSTQSQGGAIVGTPSYMAPEQASGQCRNIGPAADIYALGAILYDLLTGRPPFKAATTLETLEQVREHEPASPLKLQPGCPRDLDTICLKCLSKDPARRYASAADLADDLRQFLAHEPIHARPIGVIERIGKWVRRRPAVAALMGVSIAAVLAVVVVGGVSYWGITDALDEKTKSESDAKAALAKLEIQEAKTQASLTREKEAGVAMQQALLEKQKALKREELARVDLQGALEREKLLRRQDRHMAYLGKISLAQRALERNDVAQADHYLHECPFDLRQWEWHYLSGARYAEITTFRGHDESVRSIAYRPDGRRIASVSGRRDRSIIRVWDPVTGKEDFSLPCTGTVENVAFSPNGEWLAASASNETDKTGWLKVWHAQKGTQIKVSNYNKDTRVRVSFSADSSRLIIETNRVVQSIDTTTWKPGPQLIVVRGPSAHAAFSPDGNTFAYYRRETAKDIKGRATVRLHNIQTHQEQVFPAHSNAVTSLAFSQDGKYVAAGDIAGAIQVWDVASGKEIHLLLGHVNNVVSLAFSADHRYLVSGSMDHTANVWHAATGQLAFTIRNHTAPVHCAAFAPDGEFLATASADKTVKVWRLSTKAAVEVAGLDGADGQLTGLAFHPKGHLALATRDGAILVRQSMTRAPTRLDGPSAEWQQLAYSKDGRILAAAGVANPGKGQERPACIVQTWDAEGKARAAFRGHESEDHARRGKRLSVCLSLSAKESLAASATRDEYDSAPHTVKIWDPFTGAERFTYRGHEASIVGVAFSPDGTRVASAEWSFKTQRRRIKVWNATDGKDLFTLGGFFGPEADGLAFSPDGAILAACSGHKVSLWDARSGVPLRTLTGHSGQVLSLDFSADGQRLLTVSQDRTAKLWDIFTGREALTLHLGTDQGIVQARFSPDQQSVAALAVEGERRYVKLWLAPMQHEPIVLGGTSSPLRHLSFSPDGRWLFAGGNDFTAWNLETNREEFRLPKAAAYAPEGDRCAVVDVVDPETVSLKIVDVTTRQELFTLCQNRAGFSGLAFSPDGRRLAVPLFDHPNQRTVLKLFDVRTGQELIAFSPHAGQVWTMAFTDDGQRLIAFSSTKEKGELKTWNTATGAEVEAHTLDTGQAFPATLSPDRRYLATNGGATLKGEVKLWDVASGQHLSTIPLPRRGINLAFSPDGKYLAVATEVYNDPRIDGMVQICAVPSCQQVLSLLDPGQRIWRVAFHPQGRWLATGYQHVKLWDLKALQP